MNVKSFLKPTVAKVVLLLVLFISTSLLAGVHSQVENFYGFPGSFAWLMLIYDSPTPAAWNYDIGAMAVDVAIWYLVSCALVTAYEASKKRTRSR